MIGLSLVAQIMKSLYQGMPWNRGLYTLMEANEQQCANAPGKIIIAAGFGLLMGKLYDLLFPIKSSPVVSFCFHPRTM